MEKSNGTKLNKSQRMLLHVPVGLAAVAIAWLSPVLCATLSFGFIAYEVTQMLSVSYKDKGWYDVSGFLWGVVLGSAAWMISLCI